MSLEQALKENTEAVNKLIAVMAAARTAGCQGSEEAQVPAEKPSGNAATRTAKQTATTAPATPAAEPPSELTYNDIRGPFLQLVNKDREKALSILASLGVATLKGVEDKPELFASVLEKING